MASSGLTVKIYRERLAELVANELTGNCSDMHIDSWMIGEMGWSWQDGVEGGQRIPNLPDVETEQLVASISAAGPGPADCSDNNTPPAPGQPASAGTANGLRVWLPAPTINIIDQGTVKIEATVPADAGVGDGVLSPDGVEQIIDGNSKLFNNCQGEPRFFELGLFNAANQMIVYATFDEVIKVPGTALQFEITIQYYVP